MINTVSPIPASRKRTALRVSSAVLTLMLGVGFVPTQAPRAAFAAADKFYLVYRAQAGQVKKTKEDATIKFEIGGQAITMDYKGTSKVTYSKVGPNGEVTLEDKTETEEYTVNGRKTDQGEANEDTSAVTLKPNGEIAGYTEEKKDKDAEEDDDHLGVRLQAASTPIFPAKIVGAGDKWAHDYKADVALSTRDAHADFELVGFEKIGGTNTAKIKMTYAESGSDAITMKGTIWVDVATGDPVRDDFEATGIPFGPDGTRATGTFHDERTDGGPYAANQTPKPLTEAPKMIAAAAAPAKADGKKPGTTAATAKPGDNKPIEAAKPPEPKKEKTIDETVKEGFTKIPGLVTLFRKKEAGKDTIYAELPEDQLGKLMMLQATASTGTAEQIVAGDPINDIVFKLEKIDDRIFFTIPNFYYRAANPEIAKSVRRSFADGYLQAFKIEAKQADRKSVLIDISDLFRGDLAQISAAFSGGGGLFGPPGGGGFGMDRDKTFIKEMKNFPENLVVSTQYHFQRGGRGFSAALADPRSAPITVVYNLSVLPGGTDYTPRLSDDRVGYFETGFQSFDDDAKRDQMTRYILRWDLKKKDPTAAMSEPVKPITFWLDNAIPKEYRPSFEKAFLIWNSAFEKIGYKNAIVVKQMPDSPDPNDPNTPSDTADMRFNCVRYVHSPDNAYAVALFRTNPMTGQILNASITVDAGIVRFTKVEHQKEIDPAQAFAYGAGIPQEEERLRQKLAATGKKSGATFSGLAKHDHADPRTCSYAHEAKTQAHFGYHALAAQSATGTLSPTDLKAYTDQFIVEVVGHEFGHILGLRHNFIASKEYTLAQLADKSTTDKGGIGASLMDYNAFNIAALNKKGAAFYSTNIGTYDRWAVEYGYTNIPAAKSPDEEKFALAQIAKQSGMPGHAYLSDEVADSFDPDVARFDMGKDNLEYQKQTMALSRKLLATLDKRVPKNGESYWEFTQDFNGLLGMYARGAGYATRFIGGQHISRSHRGDMNEKPALTTVSADTQRQALAMLVTNVFAPDAMPVPKRYYSKLASDPTGFGADEVPMLDRLSSIQRTALSRLFSSTMLSRIANNEYKATAKEKPVTLPYLFQTVGSNVWAEIPAKTDVNPLRRNLQRAYVDRMIDVALKGGVNADAQMLAWNELRGMKTKLATAKAVPTLDTYTKAHYADSFDKINRALDARITLGQASSGPNINDILSMLLGKSAQDGTTAVTAPSEGGTAQP